VTSPPQPTQVARFSADVRALTGPINKRPIAIAVSGGPDSMAMLALAAAAFPGAVVAATVDHRLRPANADEAAMVSLWCKGQRIDHKALVVEEELAPGENVHDWARRHRYRLLNRWAHNQGAQFLATAHHADDQAETFLMRAARGSGAAGLSGIRAHQPAEFIAPIPDTPTEFDTGSLAVIRPLLGWRSAELRAIAIALALPFVDDPSNTNRQFSRTQFRELLARETLLDPAQLAQSAAHVAQADAALRSVQAWLWLDRRRQPINVDDPEQQIWLALNGLPQELKRRLSREAINFVRSAGGIIRPDFTDATNIEPLLNALEAGTSATQAGVLVSRNGEVWRFAKAPPRRFG